ncbi:MAG: methyltransferase domain-containing protein [Colwellia sp.]
MKAIVKNEHHSLLLEQYLPLIKKLTRSSKLNAKQSCVLDLACGTGRNGRYLLDQGVDVCFADINSNVLKEIEESIGLQSKGSDTTKKTKQGSSTFWQVDFEEEGSLPLQGKRFAGIIVFRYLHRALFEQIKKAIIPGGFIIYETFTVDNREFGRPNNPNFLLEKGELTDIFSGWKVEYDFEGVVGQSDPKTKQAIAQIIATKVQ